MNEWWQRSKVDELKPVPWLHEEVIRFLEGILKPEFQVLEHGSGGSTLWMAQRVETVFAVESDFNWFNQVGKMAPTNAVVLNGSAPPKFKKPYDLLLIDGEPVEMRAEWLRAASTLVKKGGWVALDNANRPEYEEERFVLINDHVEYWVTFNVNPPGCRHLVTEFYKMRGRPTLPSLKGGE